MKVGLTSISTLHLLSSRSRTGIAKISPERLSLRLPIYQARRSFTRIEPNPIVTMDCRLHIYHPKRRLNLLEYTRPASVNKDSRNNVLLFVGGMFDNFRSCQYVDELAQALETSSWRVCHIQLSSATRNFGTFSLTRDVEEIDTCVKFIRGMPKLGNGDSKIVLLGHSTGCQDTLTYIYTAFEKRPHSPIHGAILQAAVSDREGAMNAISTEAHVKALFDKCMNMVSNTPKDEHKTTVLPMHWTTSIFGPTPMSIARFLSLISPESPSNPAADDLFSSDIPESELAKTFGKVGADSSPLQPLPSSGKRSLMVLQSGSDEYCAPSTSQADLLGRWRKAIETGGGELHHKSRVIENGLHDLSGSSEQQKHGRQVIFKGAILSYLDDILGNTKQSDIEQGVSGMKL